MKRILVIEDEICTRNLFLECLEAEGFHPIAAKNGRLGIQQAQEQLPDLVICDIVMPEVDGYGVLTTLRQNPITAIIPFIFLSAKGTKSEIRKGMELGADDYLTKPSTVEELLGAITSRLEKQETLQQWYSAQPQQSLPPATKIASTPTSIFPSIPQLSKVFGFIEANYHQPISLSDVAEAVGYSPAYLTDLVRRQTGQTLHRWIVERRMVEARRLLIVTSQSVQQIAEAVGYTNTSHFIGQFRRFKGMTPQAWRQAHQS